MTNQPGPSSAAFCSNKLRLLAFAPVLLFALTMITMQSAQAQGFNILYTFTGGAHGFYPSGLIFDRSGNLYGIDEDDPYFNGAVFELMREDSTWVLEPLYNFPGGSGGSGPGGVIFGPDGALYGTTGGGGGVCGGLLHGCGTVFRLAPSPSRCGNIFCLWNESLLFTFGYSLGDDGYNPNSGVIFDSAGNIYGITYHGGLYNAGTAFQLVRTQNGWVENILDNFPFSTGYPGSGLTLDSSGNLYGTSIYGGTYGLGRVYQLVHTGEGWTDNTIYSFQGDNDGRYPSGGLIFDAAGNAYGTTGGNGPGDGQPGTVYQLTPQADGTWRETVLHVFPNDIFGPAGNLVMDAAGNLYGLTQGTPGNNPDKWGMIFELSPVNGSWIFTQLHEFTNGDDGSTPSGITLDAAGNLYGASVHGGAHGWGLIWEITP